MKRKFTDEQEQLICLSFLKGKRLVKLAKEWHCGHSMVINVLERNSIDAATRRAIRKRDTCDASKVDK